jgi:hypothetical protein
MIFVNFYERIGTVINVDSAHIVAKCIDLSLTRLQT